MGNRETYKHATVMRAKTSGASVDEGDIHVMDGKDDEIKKEQMFNDDNEIVVITWERLKTIELPDPMTSRGIMSYLNENFEEHLSEIADE